MLKEQAKVIRAGIIAFDLVLAIASFCVAYVLRKHALPGFWEGFGPVKPLPNYLWLLLIFLPVWFFLFSSMGLYSSMRLKRYNIVAWEVIKSFIFCFLIAGALNFFVPKIYYNRPVIFMFVGINFFLMFIEKMIVRALLMKVRMRGYNFRNILVVGTNREARKVAKTMTVQAGWGLKVAGFIRAFDDVEAKGFAEDEIIGTVEDIEKILDEKVIDEVFFVVPFERLHDLEPTILLCQEVGVTVHVYARFFDVLLSNPTMENYLGVPIISYYRAPHSAGALALKRLVDIVISFLALVLFSWLFIIISLAIKLTSKGPVFFRQTRSGKNGRTFTLCKFRTMVANAESLQKSVAHLNETSGPVFKIKKDPRVTRVGRLLRKFSLDELPQLWNVLIGDMSLVGPRPPIPAEVEKYERWQRRRLSMKPGITCLWQVRGRSRLGFEDWMKLDMEYIDNWSLTLDFKILLLTLPAVLFARGAF
ncbi:MAG: sugar transferase [Planctomycetota bacterium]|jgi:exopolysaccharide biosynthesis polyprenyl glycosylphosphotransferase